MKIKRLLLLLALPLVVASCTSYKNVPYLQNPEAVNDSEEILPLYDAKIMPKDLLSITVNTTDPKSATPFNLTVQTPINAALTNISTTTQPTMQQYLVNNKGEIEETMFTLKQELSSIRIAWKWVVSPRTRRRT